MAAVFLKISKVDFLEKATFKIFLLFFGGLSIIWTAYSPSLASGKQFLSIKNKRCFEKNQSSIFSKTTEESSKYHGKKLFRNEFPLKKLLSLF